MKNYFGIFILTMFLLTACSEETKQDPENSPISQPETTEEPANVSKALKTNSKELSQIEKEEAEFNASGRAKAIEKESDLWNLFENEEVGFSFQYPGDVTVIEGMETPNPDQLSLLVTLKEIGKVDEPGDLDKAESQKNIEALNAGEFGTVSDFALESSQKTTSVGFLFAQDYLVLSRFEVCNVTLERKLSFYFNNQFITLAFKGPAGKLIETMPDYFVEDAENCGNEKVWDFDKQDAFYQTLVEGNGAPEIQDWFQRFDQIAETITVNYQ